MSLDPVVSVEVEASQHAWKATRRFLNQNRIELTRAAIGLYDGMLQVGSTLLLSHPAWLPGSPRALEDLQLEWIRDPIPAAVLGNEPESEAVRPLGSRGWPFPTYSDAVAALDRPALFENRAAYRMVDVDFSHEGRLAFSHGKYFDVINVSEAVAHEFAGQLRAAGRADWSALPFRTLVGDPLDLARRPLLVAISALTLRRDTRSGEASFVLHWRDPKRVATNPGLYQVMPVGMFQPTSGTSHDVANDFDLWRTLVREYSEEFLGVAERSGTNGQILDYEAWPFFRAMSQARREHRLRVHCFGVGIDPLTLVADILMAVVIDGDVFDDVLGGTVAINEEGRVITGAGESGRGVPFREEAIEQFVSTRPMQPAGSATIALAWRYRDLVLSG